MSQRFFALVVVRRRDVLTLLGDADVFRAPPRAVVPLCPFKLPLFAFAGFRAPTAFPRLPTKPVAPSSCRCSEPIMRPNDSADRSSGDSSSRDRSRAGRAGSTFFLAIHSPFRGPVALGECLSKARASYFRPWIVLSARRNSTTRGRGSDPRDCVEQAPIELFYAAFGSCAVRSKRSLSSGLTNSSPVERSIAIGTGATSPTTSVAWKSGSLGTPFVR